MTQEQGKVLAEARLEVLVTADIIDWYAEEGRRAYGRIVPGRAEERAPDGDAGAGRRGRGVHAVEFPDAHARAQDRRRARRRLLAHPQGVGRDAGKLRRAGALLRRRRRAAGRAQSRVRRAGESLRAPDRRPTIVRKISFTGSIPVGKHLAALAAKGMKRATHGARRPFAGGGVRRRRSGEDRRHHRGVQVSQRRTGLHLADALLCAGAGLRPLPQALHRIRQRHQARRRPRGRHHHGPAGQFAPARRAWRASSTTPRTAAARSSPAASGAATRATSSSRRWSPTCRTTPR